MWKKFSKGFRKSEIFIYSRYKKRKISSLFLFLSWRGWLTAVNHTSCISKMKNIKDKINISCQSLSMSRYSIYIVLIRSTLDQGWLFIVLMRSECCIKTQYSTFFNFLNAPVRATVWQYGYYKKEQFELTLFNLHKGDFETSENRLCSVLSDILHNSMTSSEILFFYELIQQFYRGHSMENSKKVTTNHNFLI